MSVRIEMRSYGLLFLMPLLLTGCDPGRRMAPPQPMQSAQAPPPTDSQADPLAGQAPGGAGGGSSDAAAGDSSATTPPDPLLSGSDTVQSTPDPLAAGGDPLKGPVMPTQHSHWLSMESGHGRLIVALDGIRYGGTVTSGTHDITMCLRPGINTLSVRFQPQTERGWASVVLTEGERGPTGQALATFLQPPLPDTGQVRTAGSPPLPEITRTMTFTAK